MQDIFKAFLQEIDSTGVILEAYTIIYESDYVDSRIASGEDVLNRIINESPTDMANRFKGEKSGGFIFDYGDFNLVLFKEISRAIGEYNVYGGKPTMVMYVLDEHLNSWMNKLSDTWDANSEDVKRVLNSIIRTLKNNATTIVHEWTHKEDDDAKYLLNEKNRIRRPSNIKIASKVADIKNNIAERVSPSADVSDVNSVVKASNSDIEFNAQLVSAISEARRNGKTANFNEFLHSILTSKQFSSRYASNKHMLTDRLYKRLLKRVSDYYHKHY